VKKNIENFYYKTDITNSQSYLGKFFRNAIKCDWIHARIEEAEAESYDAKSVPEIIVVFFRVWMEIKPEIENVLRQKADSEDDDK